MKITQLQCDNNKNKYNFIVIVNNSCSYKNIYELNTWPRLFSRILSF